MKYVQYVVSGVVPCGQKGEGQRDRHDEANSRFTKIL